MPRVHHFQIIEMRKTRIYMDKPIIVGQAILDKSKELMYKFFYENLNIIKRYSYYIWILIALYF